MLEAGPAEIEMHDVDISARLARHNAAGDGMVAHRWIKQLLRLCEDSGFATATSWGFAIK